jgi:hypothetical protein
MKTLLFASLLLITAPLYAQNCEVTELILAPSVKTAEDCSTLRAWGPADLQSCSAAQAELTIATGGVYEMKPTETAWVSKTSFQDEDRSGSTTIFTLNLAKQTYDVQQIDTDSRGHVRSQLSCAGKVQIGSN